MFSDSVRRLGSSAVPPDTRLRERRFEALRGQGRAAQAHAGRIEDGIGECSGDRADRAFTRAGGRNSGRLISTMSTVSGASVMSRIG